MLKLDNVTIKYGSVIAVENISFSVQNGDFLCVIGANGAGKSTILQAVLKLLPIAQGSIDLQDANDKISYLPQYRSADKSFPANVKEIVLTGRQKTGFRLPFYTENDVKEAEIAMKQFGVSPLAGCPIGSLSGGQMQRVLLARAMCRKPKMLILDEPTTGLDETVTADLYSLLKTLNTQKKVTIIMVIHNTNDAINLATHIAEIDKTLKFYGSCDEWKKRRGDCQCH